MGKVIDRRMVILSLLGLWTRVGKVVDENCNFITVWTMDTCG